MITNWCTQLFRWTRLRLTEGDKNVTTRWMAVKIEPDYQGYSERELSTKSTEVNEMINELLSHVKLNYLADGE